MKQNKLTEKYSFHLNVHFYLKCTYIESTGNFYDKNSRILIM